MKTHFNLFVILMVYVSSVCYSQSLTWETIPTDPVRSSVDIPLEVMSNNPGVKVLSWNVEGQGEIKPSTDPFKATFITPKDFVGKSKVVVKFTLGRNRVQVLMGEISSINSGATCSSVSVETISGNNDKLHIPVHKKVWIDVVNKNEFWETDYWMLYYENDYSIFDSRDHSRGAVIQGPTDIYLRHIHGGVYGIAGPNTNGTYTNEPAFNTTGNHPVKLRIYVVEDTFEVGMIPPPPCGL